MCASGYCKANSPTTTEGTCTACTVGSGSGSSFVFSCGTKFDGYCNTTSGMCSTDCTIANEQTNCNVYKTCDTQLVVGSADDKAGNCAMCSGVTTAIPNGNCWPGRCPTSPATAVGVCTNACTDHDDCNSNYCIDSVCTLCASNTDCNTKGPKNFFGMCTTAGKCETACTVSNNEPPVTCQSNVCSSGVCVGCNSDTNCPTNKDGTKAYHCDDATQYCT